MCGLGLPRSADRMEDRGKLSAQGKNKGFGPDHEFRHECRVSPNIGRVQKEEFKRLGVMGIGSPLCDDEFCRRSPRSRGKS